MGRCVPVECGRHQRPKSTALLDRHHRVDRDLDIAETLGGGLAGFDRLPRWEQDLWIARWRRSKTACPDCGNPIEQCSDPERAWYPYRRICYATLERETAQAALAALRKDKNFHDGTFTRWSKDWSREFACPAGAGETVGVAADDLSPWDEFTTKLNASPHPPSDGAAGSEIPDSAGGD